MEDLDTQLTPLDEYYEHEDQPSGHAEDMVTLFGLLGDIVVLLNHLVRGLAQELAERTASGVRGIVSESAMACASHTSAYDPIAEMYHRLWADWYLPAALPALERLLFSRLGRGSQVLDLCCGCGHVTRELVRRGYAVTGVDVSAALIEIARRELPQATFFVQDARELQMPARFDAVLSTYDSLNHMLTLDELRRVIRGVHRSLRPGGCLVFDMNLEEAYCLDLGQWTVQMAEGGVGLMRGSYDQATKLARTELIWFARMQGDVWRRRRSVVEERCYAEAEVLQALDESGFDAIEAVDALEAGMRADVGLGRMFFTARAAVQK